MKTEDGWLRARQMEGFKKNFHAFKDKKIALYGIGKNAVRVLSHGKAFKIVAVAAKEHIGENFHGHVIRPLAEVVAASDMMIIAATPQATKEVYVRIGEKVPSGYPVYDLLGRNLTKMKEQKPLAHCDFSSLRKAINAHDVISFDIFDTLVMRKVLHPQDVFHLEERELREQGEEVPFAAWRMAAETEQARAGHLPNFKEIYRQLQKMHALSDAKIRLWQAREWELEEELLVPREDMVAALRYAKAQGKTVCLTSDMYFSKQEMKQLLLDKGIAEYDDVLVSCDMQAAKADGHLFHPVIERAGGRTILHVGDNEVSDDIVPRRLGIDTYPIPKAADLLASSAGAEILNHAETLEDRLLLGTILAHVCNSPFSCPDPDGRLKISSLKELSCLCLLPVTMRYLQFLGQTVQGEQDAVLLFLSRDGYFLQKVYAALAEKYQLPDSLYFYASRQAANGVMVQDEADIALFLQTILERSGQNLKFQLEYFFQVPFDASFDLSVGTALEMWGREEITRKVKREATNIFRTQAVRRENYQSYLHSLHLERYSKVYCVDIVTKGTVLRCLQKILPQPVELIAMGGLPALHDFIPDAAACHLMLGIMTRYSVFAPWFPVLELPYASCEGQLKEFSKDGRPRFVEGTAYRAELLEGVQDELERAMREFPDDEWLRHPLSDAFCSSMLGLLHPDFTEISSDVLDEFQTSDPEQFDGGRNILRYLRGEL